MKTGIVKSIWHTFTTLMKKLLQSSAERTNKTYHSFNVENFEEAINFKC